MQVAWKRICEKRLWVVIGYSQSYVAQINQEETTVFLLKRHYITFYTNNSGAHQFEKRKKKSTAITNKFNYLGVFDGNHSADVDTPPSSTAVIPAGKISSTVFPRLGCITGWFIY